MRFLSYSNDIDEHRTFQRVPWRESVSIQQGEYTIPVATVSQNLSAGGLCIQTIEFLPFNTPVNLQIKLEYNKVVYAQAKVAWVEKIAYNDRYKVGLEFTSLASPTSLINLQKEILTSISQKKSYP